MLEAKSCTLPRKQALSYSLRSHLNVILKSDFSVFEIDVTLLINTLFEIDFLF
jgi:hypothetical protein